MGYGPYVVKEWNDDSLRLTKNPYYFRAAEGLPKFDELIFRIVPTRKRPWPTSSTGAAT